MFEEKPKEPNVGNAVSLRVYLIELALKSGSKGKEAVEEAKAYFEYASRG